MPNREPVVAQQDAYTLRHIGPKAAVWPDAPGSVQTFALLGQSAMVARPLRSPDTPASAAFVSGSWTVRVEDAGECQIVFPNAVGPDGIAWRDRFDPTGHNQFLEVRYNGVVEFVGVIDQVQCSQQAVTVHCYDAFWLLKKAYERDWTVVQAPHDVIQRATQLWVPVVADNFPNPGSSISGTTITTPTGSWTTLVEGGTPTVTIGASGGLVFTATSNSEMLVSAPTVTVGATGVWRATLATGQSGVLNVTESSGDEYQFEFGPGAGHIAVNGTIVIRPTFPVALAYTAQIESDGEWVWFFQNGAMVGCLRRSHATTTSLALSFFVYPTASTPITVTGTICEALVPFLM
ncbi:MAG: hypothetical protein ACYCQK_02125 [Acidiferrobacteraceae bacterium]